MGAASSSILFDFFLLVRLALEATWTFSLSFFSDKGHDAKTFLNKRDRE